MSVQTFKASHCGETFAGAEGAKALEAHMKTAHDRKMIVPGSNVNRELRIGHDFRPAPVAPGWARGEILPPAPWVAPRPQPGGIAKVMDNISSGKYGQAVVIVTEDVAA